MAVVGNVDILITATSERLGRDLQAAGSHVKRFERTATTSVRNVERQTASSASRIKNLLQGLGLTRLGGGFGLLKLGAAGLGIAGITTIVDLMVRGQNATMGFSGALINLGVSLGIVAKQSKDGASSLQVLIDKLEELRQKQLGNFEQGRKNIEGRFFGPAQDKEADLFANAFQLREAAAKRLLELNQIGPQMFFDAALKDAQGMEGRHPNAIKAMKADIEIAAINARNRHAEEVAKARGDFEAAEREMQRVGAIRNMRENKDFLDNRDRARAFQQQQKDDFVRWNFLTNRVRGGAQNAADFIGGFGFNLRAPGVSIGRLLGQANNAFPAGGNLLASLFGGSGRFAQFMGGAKGLTPAAMAGSVDAFRALHGLGETKDIQEDIRDATEDSEEHLRRIVRSPLVALGVVQVRM